MKIQKTFKYLLKPTKNQKEQFARSAGSARFVFNHGLVQIKKAFEEKTKIPRYKDLANQLPTMKCSEQTSWLKEIHSQILQQSLKNLETAINHFWRRLKLKKDVPGFPRFKKKGVHDSFRYPQGVKLSSKHVYLPKIGFVRYKNSRPIEGVIKQTTIIREGDRWFVALTCEFDKQVKKVKFTDKKAVGIDVGLKNFATLSSGRVIENPRYLAQDLKRLKKAQRDLSRKIKGSKNRKKMVQRVGKIHISIKNKRKDFLHQESMTLVKNHDVVAVENLNIAGMIQNRRLSQSISDVGWNTFLSYLKYKCPWNGKYYVEIDRFEPTSKRCSRCGLEQEMPLKIRMYQCNSCGNRLDRDLNASINIRAAGISVLKACGGIDVGLPEEAGIGGF